MASQIDATKPTAGEAFTADVRQNFAHARDEIGTLQTLVSALTDRVTALEAQVTTAQADIVTLKGRAMSAATVVTANPPNTNSAVFVTAGVGAQFTAPGGTRALFIAEGELGNTQNGSESQLQLCYGTGAAPPFGTLLSATNGQLIGATRDMQSARSNDYAPFSASALLEGLVPGGNYWLGVAFRAVNGTATLSQMTLIGIELLDPLVATSSTTGLLTRPNQ